MWTHYVECLKYYFLANGTQATDKKRDVFSSVLGSDTYRVLQSLIPPSKPLEISFTQIMKVLKDHYNLHPSEIMQKFHFNSRVSEKVITYLAELHGIAEHCNLGVMLDGNQLHCA